MQFEYWQENYWLPERDKARRPTGRYAAQRLRKRDKVIARLREWEKMVEKSDPKFKQAKHMIKKFGGIIPFSIAAGFHPEDICRYWLAVEGIRLNGKGKVNYPELFTNGLIPMQQIGRLIIAARYWGVLLLPEDIYPDFVGADGVKNFHNNKEIMKWIQQIEPSAEMKHFESDIALLVSTPE